MSLRTSDFALPLSIFLLLLMASMQAHASCAPLVFQDIGTGFHFNGSTHCDSKESALGACTAFTAEHSYSAGDCHLSGNSDYSSYSAGWLLDNGPGGHTPFWFGQFTFCPAFTEIHQYRFEEDELRIYQWNRPTQNNSSLCPWRPPVRVEQQRSCGSTGGSGPGAYVGNPIDCTTGIKEQTELDYTSVDFELARTFHSATNQTAPMEAGWRINLPSLSISTTLSYEVAVYVSGNTRRAFIRNIGTADWSGNRADDGALSYSGGKNIFRLPSGASYEFGSTGRLTARVEASGRRHELSYQSPNVYGGTTTIQTSPRGRIYQLLSDAQGRVRQFIDPADESVFYEYDGAGRLVTVRYPDGTPATSLDNPTRQYTYEDVRYPEALTGIIDEQGERYARWEYDNNGRAILSEHGGGAERVTLEYVSATTTKVREYKDMSNYSERIIRHQIKGSSSYARRRITSIEHSYCPDCGLGNGTETYAYDGYGMLMSKTDRRGTVTDYTHETNRGLETSRTEAKGTGRQRTTTTTWHSWYAKPYQIDAPGKRTSFTFDTSGNIWTRTETDLTVSPNVSRTWTYTYNSFAQVLTADGPRTDVPDVTTYTYYNCNTGYECGQVKTITNALGHVTTYNSYNAHGRPLRITDPNGVVTTLTYDARQRLNTRTVGTEVTSFDYWPTGLLKKATMPDGSYLEYAYDAAHRLTDINDAEGNHIHYTLDAMGNRTAEEVLDLSSALTRTRTRVFNTLNQLYRELGAAGTPQVTTTFGYDNNGNQTSIDAPLGRSTSQTYDELNRLSTVTDPESGITTYGYNRLDQLISVTDPRNRVTSYTYSALGDLTQQVSPDTGTTTNTYDSAGNLLTSTDARNKTATYSYDALNRISTVTYADQAIGYTYDGGTNQKGRLTQLTDNSGSTSWSYDGQGRVLSRQQTMGAVSKGVGYSYDAHGRLQTITLPSGNAVTYGYANGKVVSLTLNASTTLLSNVLYQPFGPTSGWTWGNGTLAIRDYDQDGNIRLADSAGLKTYSYDDAFRITAITDATDPNLSQSYGYDSLDRLTSATGSNLDQSWTYDANGNRLTQGGSQASTYTVSTTSNRLNSISGALTRSYGYDNAGNTTSDGSATFTYNDAGRMISATKSGVTSTYALNGLGQRVRKNTSGVSTYFVYDEAGHHIGEYHGSGKLFTETIWFDDIPVATIRPKGTGVDLFYIHTDHLNTPRRISRPSDNVVVWRWDSDPFGTTPANEDPDGDSTLFAYNLRFPGQYFDRETGLLYNYYRDYDPATGRYVQSDPIGLKPLRFAAVRNLYGYVEGDPIGNVDPFGLETAQITMRYPLPPPALSGSWGVGGCLGTFCIDWDSNDADSVVSVPFPPEIGGGITFCAKPEPTCDAPTDQGGKAINFGLGKRAGVSVGFDGKLCVNLGLGLGSPISFSGDVGPLD